jgi:hypothetical protein
VRFDRRLPVSGAVTRQQSISLIDLKTALRFARSS